LTAAGVEQAWAFDEGRFGLKVWLRRRWCPYGERPPWVYVDQYEWWWLYAAVCPATGESFFLLVPRVDSTCVQIFLDAFSAHVAGQRVGLVLDGSGAHRSGKLTWPDGLVPIALPAYSPELNPVERLFEHLRQQLSNRVFEDLDELAAALTHELRGCWEEPLTLQRLVGYSWWVDATHHIMPLAS
jgi:transposase